MDIHKVRAGIRDQNESVTEAEAVRDLAASALDDPDLLGFALVLLTSRSACRSSCPTAVRAGASTRACA
jgi:hypothetical protein